MPQLSKEQILSADDLNLLEIEVPEWSGSVYCRVMSVGERDAYEREWLGKRETGVENFRTKFLQRVLCDKSGELLFSSDDIKALSNKSSAVMSRLWDMAMKHNHMLAEDVEELAKN